MQLRGGDRGSRAARGRWIRAVPRSRRGGFGASHAAVAGPAVRSAAMSGIGQASGRERSVAPARLESGQDAAEPTYERQDEGRAPTGGGGGPPPPPPPPPPNPSRLSRPPRRHQAPY